MRKLPLVIAALVALGGALAGAQDKMIIGVIQSEPLAYTDASGKPAGIHYELVAAVFKKAGFAVDIQILPKARLLEQIKLGAIDGGVFFANPDVADLVASVGVIDRVPFVAIARKGLPMSKYENLYDCASVSMLSNTAVTPQFDGDAKIKKNQVSDYETLSRLLVNARTDAVIGNAWVLSYQLKKEGYITIGPEQIFKFKDIPNELFVRKASKFSGNVTAISAALKALDSDGTFKSVVLKYAGDAVRAFK